MLEITKEEANTLLYVLMLVKTQVSKPYGSPSHMEDEENIFEKLGEYIDNE